MQLLYRGVCSLELLQILFLHPHLLRKNKVRVDTAKDTEYTLPITTNTKALKFFTNGNRFRGYIKKIWLEK